jgi:hypothetical protein
MMENGTALFTQTERQDNDVDASKGNVGRGLGLLHGVIGRQALKGRKHHGD